MDNSFRRHQKNYRSLLQAVSRPGRLVRLEALEFVSSFAAALALAECLLDSEVSHCVTGNGGAQNLRTAITRATGARRESLEAADFVFVAGISSQGSVRVAKRGAPECPEEGATIVYCLDSQPATASDRFRVRLSGPGIAEAGGIAPEMGGIPVTEFHDLMAVNADYPLGVDIFFIRPSGEVMGLPRSTRIQVR
jgi:alpha-D-ribose 1-methylphosphonate 5-triphosphate synthase subunit PhnH